MPAYEEARLLTMGDAALTVELGGDIDVSVNVRCLAVADALDKLTSTGELFGVFVVLVVEVAQITPPVGLNLFVLQGLTKRDIGYISKTVIPMFALMMLAIVLIYYFPGIVLWLPSLM